MTWVERTRCNTRAFFLFIYKIKGILPRRTCPAGLWLKVGTDLLREKSTADWLVTGANMFWEKSIDGWWPQNIQSLKMGNGRFREKTLGKSLAKCNTSQISFSESRLNKTVFVQCLLSITWQTLCRVLKSTLGKELALLVIWSLWKERNRHAQ
jgi:hypothetical protein